MLGPTRGKVYDWSMLEPLLEGLNPEQRAAVLQDGASAPSARPLLIIAGAGSGKTKTLAHRLARLVAEGADPRRILLLTFTRRAAEALTRRAERVLALALGEGAGRAGALEWAGTFHAVGARLLRAHAAEIGLSPDFTLLDRGDAADLLNLLRAEQGLDRQRSRFPKKGTCLAIYSYAINSERTLPEVLAERFPWCADWGEELKGLFRAYAAAKREQSLLDYDDLLLYWAGMLSVPELAAAVGARFDHVLVDEYQDTNPLQAAILLRMKPKGNGVAVVGDDAQAIYGFRAATQRNILDFPSLFDPPAETVTLSRNYRSVQPILTAANGVIALAKEGYRKNLVSERSNGDKPLLLLVKDEAEQVDYVVRTLLENREAGIELAEQAVLFRAAHHSAALEIELARRNIPFVKFGGLRFLETAHVKDLLAFLRWAENPRDRVAAFRVLQLLPGIGPGTARRLLERVEASGRALAALPDMAPPSAAQALWPAFAATLSELAASRAWEGDIGRLRRFYDPLLPELYDFAGARRKDLDALETVALRHESRSRFLQDLALDPPETLGGAGDAVLKDEEYLVLSTIHSAKGQEWRAVFLLNVVDGAIPSDLAAGSPAELEEERRLLYVAMTRARDQLHLIAPHRFYVTGQARLGDRQVTAERSRFLPDGLLGAFRVANGTAPMAQAAPVAAAPAADRQRIDVAKEAEGLWL